jgi:hypothetical protein
MLGGRWPPVTSDRLKPHRRSRRSAHPKARAPPASGFVRWRDHDVTKCESLTQASHTGRQPQMSRMRWKSDTVPPILVDSGHGSSRRMDHIRRSGGLNCGIQALSTIDPLGSPTCYYQMLTVASAHQMVGDQRLGARRIAGGDRVRGAAVGSRRFSDRRR